MPAYALRAGRRVGPARPYAGRGAAHTPDVCYLGSGYKVLASYGHVRDLIEKDGSVDPAQDFDMKWELRDKRNALGEIQKSLK